MEDHTAMQHKTAHAWRKLIHIASKDDLVTWSMYPYVSVGTTPLSLPILPILGPNNLLAPKRTMSFLKPPFRKAFQLILFLKYASGPVDFSI